MRQSLASLLVCALCGLGTACSSKNDSILVVSVDGPATLPAVYYLRATISNAGAKDYRQFPTGASTTRIAFPTSFGLNLARSHQGPVDLIVDGYDAQMNVVATGHGTVTLKVGERNDLCIGLALAPSLCQGGTDAGLAVPDSGSSSEVAVPRGDDGGFDPSGGLPSNTLFSRISAGADHN
ncbi:MAG TPA: hypothetical protein VF518_09400, partial [Polyangia bacterium]